MKEKLEKLYIKGIKIFGTEEKFDNWLNKESYGLDYQIPVNLIYTSDGIEKIMNALTSIEFGTTA